jgi:hypothetical protein
LRAPPAIGRLELRIVERDRTWSDAARREIVLRDGDGLPQAYGWARDGDHWIEFPGLATFRLAPHGASVCVAPEPSADAGLVEDVFTSTVLPLALCLAGYEALHASAVRMPAGVVALCGYSQAGKSTIAYGLSRRGHDLWADDAVVFEVPASGPPRSLRLPFSLHLRPPSRAYFVRAGIGAADAAFTPGGGPSELAGLVLLERRPPDAAPPAVVSELSLAEAVPAVLPHAFRLGLDEPDRKERALRTYLSLLAQVPVFRVGFRSELHELAGLLDELERAVTKGSGP